MKGDEDYLTTKAQDKRRKQEGSGLLKSQRGKAMGPQIRETGRRTHYSPTFTICVISCLTIWGDEQLKTFSSY